MVVEESAMTDEVLNTLVVLGHRFPLCQRDVRQLLLLIR